MVTEVGSGPGSTFVEMTMGIVLPESERSSSLAVEPSGAVVRGRGSSSAVVVRSSAAGSEVSVVSGTVEDATEVV